jgi:hypothetical protein
MSDAGSDAGSRAPEQVVEDVEVAAAPKGAMSVEDALQEVLKVSFCLGGLVTMLSTRMADRSCSTFT